MASNAFNRLAQLRADAGLTQKALADAAGMNIRQIQKIEAGEIKPENITLGNALKLSAALHILPGDLLSQSRGE